MEKMLVTSIFLLFPQFCFKASILGSWKPWLFGKGLTVLCIIFIQSHLLFPVLACPTKGYIMSIMPPKETNPVAIVLNSHTYIVFWDSNSKPLITSPIYKWMIEWDNESCIHAIQKFWPVYLFTKWKNCRLVQIGSICRRQLNPFPKDKDSSKLKSFHTTISNLMKMAESSPNI